MNYAMTYTMTYTINCTMDCSAGFIKVKYALPYSFRPAYHIFKLSKPALPFPINLFHIYNPCPPGQSSIKHSFLYKSCPLTGQQESCVW